MRLGRSTKEVDYVDTAYYPALDTAIRKARKQGIFVVGYLYTGYGQRDPALVKQRVDSVYKNYLLDGIFFDEVPTDCFGATPQSGSTYRYYQDLAHHVRVSQAGGRLVILNPGTQPPNDCWMSIANIVVTAEASSLQDYQQNYQAQAWFRHYPAERFWHIVYTVPTAAELQQIVKLSQQRNAGWIYVTDQGSSNPYGQPPGYWQLETSQVAQQDIQAPYASSRPRSNDENGNPVAAQVSFRGADYLLEADGSGQARLLRYTGDGGDWQWRQVNAHAQSQAIGSNVRVAEADSTALGETRALTFQIQAADEAGQAGFITTATPLSLDNTAYVFDVLAH